MLLQRGCPGCGEPSTGPYRRRGPVICLSCLGRGRPVGEIHGVPGLDRCGALYQYRDEVQQALLAGKYGARRDGLGHFGMLLGHLADELGFRFDVVTWVPASRHGSRQRGYDQGRLLASALGREIDAPVRRLLGPGRVGSGAVPGRGLPRSPSPSRTWSPSPSRGRTWSRSRSRGGGQTGRGRGERLSGPSLRAVRRVGGRVLIVDDVITTGASITAAAAVLRDAGAATVLGLAVAWTASDDEVRAGRPLAPQGRRRRQAPSAVRRA